MIRNVVVPRLQNTYCKKKSGNWIVICNMFLEFRICRQICNIFKTSENVIHKTIYLEMAEYVIFFDSYSSWSLYNKLAVSTTVYTSTHIYIYTYILICPIHVCIHICALYIIILTIILRQSIAYLNSAWMHNKLRPWQCNTPPRPEGNYQLPGIFRRLCSACRSMLVGKQLHIYQSI